MGAAPSSSSEKLSRNDLAKKSVLGMMDPIAVAAASEAFGPDVVDAERLRGNTELGLFHLMVGPEHAQEAYRIWTCAPPRFGTETGVPMLTVRMRDGLNEDEVDDAVMRMFAWLVHNGGVFRNVSRDVTPAITYYFQGADEATGMRYNFINEEEPFQSILMYTHRNELPTLLYRARVVDGVSLHEVMTETLPRMFPPEEFVFAFPALEPTLCPIMYPIDRVRTNLLPQFELGRAFSDMRAVFGDGARAGDLMDLAEDAMSIMLERLQGARPTADELERCRREAYVEALVDAPRDRIDRVLSNRVFFGTYAAAMGYVRHTNRPSFEVELV